MVKNHDIAPEIWNLEQSVSQLKSGIFKLSVFESSLVAIISWRETEVVIFVAKLNEVQ